MSILLLALLFDEKNVKCESTQNIIWFLVYAKQFDLLSFCEKRHFCHIFKVRQPREM